MARVARVDLPQNSLLKPLYAKQKERYQQNVGQMLALIGWADPAGSAQRIVAFETTLADAHWSRAQSRGTIARSRATAV